MELTNKLLSEIVQVLLRMAEPPVHITKELKGNKHREFWQDLGYDENIDETYGVKQKTIQADQYQNSSKTVPNTTLKNRINNPKS